MAILADATRSSDTPGADLFFGVLLIAFGLSLVVFQRRFAEDVLFIRFLRREPTQLLLHSDTSSPLLLADARC
jgi:hypothetical protein